MPLRETCDPHPESTASESSKPTNKKTTTGKKTFRTISYENVLAAISLHCRAISMIDDNEEITHFNKVFDTYEIKVEKMHD
jgi:hypothetical protein